MSTRLLAVVALLLASVSCNQRSPILNSPVLPTESPILPVGQPAVFAVTIQPGVIGPASLVGKVILTLPALERGSEVFLRSSDPSVLSVPGSVVVPAGSDTAAFAATVQGVASDRDVQVTANTAGGRSATATVAVWSVLPTFCVFWSESGDYIGGGITRRMTPPSFAVSAAFSGNLVSMNVNGPSWWYLSFQAPKGAPLTVGSYEGATRYPFQSPSEPGLSVWGDGRGCNQLSGRFTVREIDVSSSGQLRRFWATFEQHCERGTAALYGDVRFTDGAAAVGTLGAPPR
jgi:hypothetical protein